MPGGTSIRRAEYRGLGVPDACRAPRVYVVSNVRIHREGLVAILAGEGQLDVLGAGNSGDVLSQIAALRPEVLLLDLSASDSLTIPPRAMEVLPSLRVVAFAMAEVEAHVLACAEAGISGYVAQDGSVEDLVTAVLRALRGELVCSPRIAAVLFGRVATLSRGQATVPADASLTPREREVTALVACGLTNKEIARRLGLGPATVKNHVHNILQKLSIRRRGDIAGLRHGWETYRADPATRAMEPSPRSA
jgi:two-component system nitrate/nitrite response regulator NarL